MSGPMTGVGPLRLDPATGRLAERLPADQRTDDREWFTYRWDAGQLHAELLTAADVASWTEVVLAPKPAAPDYLLTIGCGTCDEPSTRVAYSPLVRDQALAEHPDDHATEPWAIRALHPHRAGDEPVPGFAAGDRVSFHGAGPGDGSHLIAATVVLAVIGIDADSEPVPGYIVAASGVHLFAPATALA